ncbi:hypothetical protein C8J56DRAFT_892179 [Mycena floridula]|nr:hypothetical protein C8J56DRAFT_892179 [Mycena floridula]
MSEPESQKPSFPRLTSVPTTNYTTWVGNARAELQTLGVWLIVKETITSPPTTDAAELRKYLVDSGKAAGVIFAALADDQKVHVKGMEENPVAIITKGDDETLNSLVTQVQNAMSLIQELCPAAFTLDDLEGELASMTMVHALPDEFQSFRSSLFLLPQRDKATIIEAFILEQADCDATAKTAATVLALQAAAAAIVTPTSAVTPALWCSWCKVKTHSTDDCRSMARAQKFWHLLDCWDDDGALEPSFEVAILIRPEGTTMTKDDLLRLQEE